jgi:hypothetical protein
MGGSFGNFVKLEGRFGFLEKPNFSFHVWELFYKMLQILSQLFNRQSVAQLQSELVVRSNDECSICLESLLTTGKRHVFHTTPENLEHVFHLECIFQTCLKRNSSLCPLCRHDCSLLEGYKAIEERLNREKWKREIKLIPVVFAQSCFMIFSLSTVVILMCDDPVRHWHGILTYAIANGLGIWIDSTYKSLSDFRVPFIMFFFWLSNHQRRCQLIAHNVTSFVLFRGLEAALDLYEKRIPSIEDIPKARKSMWAVYGLTAVSGVCAGLYLGMKANNGFTRIYVSLGKFIETL